VILLDTHVALWLVIDTKSLGKRTKQIARQALTAGQVAISAISFWEIALLIAKGRLRSVDSAADMRRQMLRAGAVELPLTGDVAILASELTGLHADPADRFIVATAIDRNATLVTADENLLLWRHSLRRQNAET